MNLTPEDRQLLEELCQQQWFPAARCENRCHKCRQEQRFRVTLQRDGR
jgi:hypothetical protein